MPVLALGVAIGLGMWAGLLDVSGTKDHLLDVAEGLGAPPATLAKIEAALGDVPDSVPVPLLGGLVSVPLPIGSLELEGAVLTDGILEGLGLWPPGGVSLADPALSVDFTLLTYRVGMSWQIGLDLGLLALSLGAGGALFGGGIVPAVTTTDPVLDPIVAAIPGEGITWSAAGGTLTAAVELGLPFLRLFVRGGVFLPVIQASGAWGVLVGGYSAAAGMVIRF
jgi:hypothetical protein